MVIETGRVKHTQDSGTVLSAVTLKSKFHLLLHCVLQEPDLPVDEEMIMLKCLETFDDDDL
jgi:hypothetical protein